MAANIDKRPIQGDLDKTIYVKNLAYRADEGALAEFFGQCGELVDLRLGRQDDGRSRAGPGRCHSPRHIIHFVSRHEGPKCIG